MSITRAKMREGGYVVGNVRRGLNANAEHPTSDPANIQDPRRIKSSQRDCERRWAGASIVCTKPKIGLHKIGMRLRSRRCLQKSRSVFCHTLSHLITLSR